jgi:hypothetical protein
MSRFPLFDPLREAGARSDQRSLHTSVLIATFRCGAFADARRAVGGDEGECVRARKVYRGPSGSAAPSTATKPECCQARRPIKRLRENFPKDYLMRRNQEAFVRSTHVETNAAVVEWKPRGVVRRRTRHRIALSQNKGLAAPDLTLACRFRPSRMRPDRFWDREIREAQIRLERRHAEDALRDSAEGYATQKGEPPS